MLRSCDNWRSSVKFVLNGDELTWIFCLYCWTMLSKAVWSFLDSESFAHIERCCQATGTTKQGMSINTVDWSKAQWVGSRWWWCGVLCPRMSGWHVRDNFARELYKSDHHHRLAKFLALYIFLSLWLDRFLIRCPRWCTVDTEIKVHPRRETRPIILFSRFKAA